MYSIYKNFGRLLMLIGVILVLIQVIFFSLNYNLPELLLSIETCYIALGLVPIGFAFFMVGIHPEDTKVRRNVDPAELQSMISELTMFKDNANESLVKIAEDEISILQSKIKSKEPVYELDALPLRKALVDLYPKNELITKANYELGLLWEYTPDTPQYDEIFDDWEQRIKSTIEKINDAEKKERNLKESDTAKNVGQNVIMAETEIEGNIEKLRPQLRSLRETVAWYDKTWAIGEIYIKGVTYWVGGSLLIMVIMGVLPLIHPKMEGLGVLGILHWASLGISGAFLSSIVSMRNLDVNEIGEQEGKQLLLKTIGRITIGALTAILLYAAIMGGILEGKLFPELPIRSDKFDMNTGLSIFWAIFAGFSLKILAGMVGIAESAFGKDSSK